MLLTFTTAPRIYEARVAKYLHRISVFAVDVSETSAANIQVWLYSLWINLVSVQLYIGTVLDKLSSHMQES